MFWFLFGCFGAAVASALIPWINGELVMLSALPTASAQGALLALVLAVTAGQMVGKSIMYWLARNARGTVTRRFERQTERWRQRFETCPRSTLGLILVSAFVGFPPFYVMSIAAGAFRMRFGPFLAIGCVGRLAHFGVLALIPHLTWRGL